MTFKILLRLIIFCSLALIFTAGIKTVNKIFAVEKLYSIQNYNIANLPLNTPEETTFKANPFVPILREFETSENSKIQRSNDSTKFFSQKFDARNLEVEILTSNPEIENSEIENCKALLEKTLTTIPAKLTISLSEIKLFFSKRNPRGLSNSHLIELRCGSLNENEIVGVFVHELGHIIDLGKMKGTSSISSNFVDGRFKIPTDDPSVSFYRLSWQNEKKQKALAVREDFVSGYAMSDPFEDFAESFNFYVLHGKDFRAIKKESHTLAKKYEFLKNEVFEGIEFDSMRSTKNGKRVWDSTLVEFDQADFFAQI